MSCKPIYREVVKEQEEKVNQKGKEHLHPFIKIIAAIITTIFTIIAILIWL